MTDVLVAQRAPFAARLLAALVAFELGDDAIGELLRSAAEEFGLDRVALWPAETSGATSGVASRAASVGASTTTGAAAAVAAGPPLREYVADPTADARGSAPRPAVRLDLPVRFGDRVVGRLRAESPTRIDPQLLLPLCDALGLLVGETGPEARSATLARRFEDRRLLIETIMEQLPVGVAVTNTAGVFQLVNQRMTDLFGPGLTGMTYGDWTLGAAQLTRPDGTEVGAAEMPLARAIQHGQTVPPEQFVYHSTRDERRGHGRIITVSAAPVLDADGALLACVVTTSDVTESHEAAAELAAVRAGLAGQVRDLSRLQRLVDTLSHTDALPQVFAELLEAVGDLLGSHAGLVMVRNPEAEVVIGGTDLADVVVAAHRGLSESQVAAIAALEQNELPTTQSAIAGFDAYISDIPSDPRCSVRYRAVTALFGAVAVHSIPLRAASGRVVGSVASFFDHAYRPSGRELSMIRTCAGIGSQLIANAEAREAEHRVAEELQRWMLQQELPTVPGVEFAARYQPATEGMVAGGDWYDVTPLPDGALALTIGDVVGHGVPAAAEMGQLRSAVRAYALTTGTDPAELLRQVNAFVAATGLGEMTTLGYLAAEPAAGVAHWVSAGHCPLLMVGPGGGAHFVVDDGLTTPLGVIDPDCPPAAEIAFGPGTTLVLYTDGLVERRKRDIDEGLALLRKTAEGFAGPVEELCDHLLAECLPTEERPDDVALLVLRNLG
jgi:PAS domain-containing protein